MVISPDVEKSFDQTKHVFMTKAVKKLGTEGTVSK
jgi:hypothetical protein